jgi:hypothetical protein
VSNESWLPAAVAIHAKQSALADEVGWAPLADLATFDDRARLSRAPEGTRALRLSEVGDDLLVDGAPSHDLIPSRTLAKPLVPGEVLLSTLGSSFLAAYPALPSLPCSTLAPPFSTIPLWVCHPTEGPPMKNDNAPFGPPWLRPPLPQNQGVSAIPYRFINVGA